MQCKVYHDTTLCEADIDSVRVITRCKAYRDTTRCEADIDSVRVIMRCKAHCDITQCVADIDRVRVIAQCEAAIILLRGRDGHYFTAWSRQSGSEERRSQTLKANGETDLIAKGRRTETG